MSDASTVTYFDVHTGRVVMVSELFGAIEALQNMPEGCAMITGELDPKTEYVLPGAYTRADRPKVPEPAGSTYDLSGLPEDAVLHVTDEEGFETVLPAQNDVLHLMDAGTYRLRSESPFPYLDFNVEVAV